MMRTSVFVAVLGAAAIVTAMGAAAQQGGEIRTLPIRGNLHLIQGAGTNIVVSIGRDGVLMVDTGLPQMSDQVIAAVRRLQQDLDLRDQPPGFGAETRSSIASRSTEAPPKPIRYIINTHAHPETIGGNINVRQCGRTFPGGNVAGNIADAGTGAAILAHENVAQLMSTPAAGEQRAPTDALPTDTYCNDVTKTSHCFNGEGVQLIHVPDAHTNRDSPVPFRGTDVIAAGDIYPPISYPVIARQHGGT